MRAKISLCDFGREVKIFIYEERGDKTFLAKPVELELEEIDRHKSIEPTLRIGGVSNQFLQSLAEELDELKIKTDKDAKIQGTLEATKYHLEDMRSLLKLKK